MNKRTTRILLVSTLSLISLGIPWVRSITDFLRQKEILVLSINVSFLLGITIVCVCFRKWMFKPVSLLWLVTVVGIYLVIFQEIKQPEERVHLLQFGLVASLMFFSLPNQSSTAKRYVLTWVLSSFLGIVDELIQALVPSRVFDVRDIVLNVAAVTLALIVLYFARPKFRSFVN